MNEDVLDVVITAKNKSSRQFVAKMGKIGPYPIERLGENIFRVSRVESFEAASSVKKMILKLSGEKVAALMKMEFSKSWWSDFLNSYGTSITADVINVKGNYMGHLGLMRSSATMADLPILDKSYSVMPDDKQIVAELSDFFERYYTTDRLILESELSRALTSLKQYISNAGGGLLAVSEFPFQQVFSLLSVRVEQYIEVEENRNPAGEMLNFYRFVSSQINEMLSMVELPEDIGRTFSSCDFGNEWAAEFIESKRIPHFYKRAFLAEIEVDMTQLAWGQDSAMPFISSKGKLVGLADEPLDNFFKRSIIEGHLNLSAPEYLLYSFMASHYMKILSGSSFVRVANYVERLITNIDEPMVVKDCLTALIKEF